MENVTVLTKSRYGILVKKDPNVWYNTKDTTLLDSLKVGQVYAIETEKTPRGTSFKLAKEGAKAAPKAEVKAAAKAEPPTHFGRPVTEYELAKDRRISRQGVIQVAVQVRGTFDEAVKLAEQMLEWTNK